MSKKKQTNIKNIRAMWVEIGTKPRPPIYSIKNLWNSISEKSNSSDL